MKFANTKIRAEQFATRYPDLFALYQQLMQVTQARFTTRRNQFTAGVDVEVNETLSACKQAEEAARLAFRENVAVHVEALNAEVRAADDELNLTLARLLRQKDEAEKPFREAEQAERWSLEASVYAAQECCRELELVERARQVYEQFQQDMADVAARFNALRSPAQEQYQLQVARAFEVRNERVRIANSSYQAAIDPHFLVEKRALRDAVTAKEAALRRIDWRRDDDSEGLHVWLSAVKQERLYLIESFLQNPCEVTWRQQMTAAIEEMSAIGN